MSRASRKANRESSRMANNSKVMRCTEKNSYQFGNQKRNETERIIQKFKERNKT